MIKPLLNKQCDGEGQIAEQINKFILNKDSKV